MSSTDPERLSSLEHAPELTDALHAARERLPDASALEALSRRVATATSVAPAPASGRWPLALKVLLPALGVAAAVVIGAQRLAPRAQLPLPQAAPRTSAISALSLPAEPTPSSRLLLPPPVENAGPRVGRPRAPSPLVNAPPQATSGVSSELDLVKHAGQALKSNPAQALQLTMDHARLYPNGALSEEREVIAIEALARLGRASASRSRAEHFMVAYPRSAHLSRVQQAAGLGANSDTLDQKKPLPPALDQQ